MDKPMYECLPCHSTGIYKGTQEPDNVGVVCNQCNGSGKTPIRYGNASVFSRRRRRNNVATVYLRGTSRRGVYEGQSVTIEQFYEGILPR